MTNDHSPRLGAFTAALTAEGFRGDVAADAATRIVNATDNSIYEVAPRLVVFPRECDDLNRVMRAARRTGIAIVARGGGTGTNGQSLTDSVVVDCSRHLTAIRSLDPETMTAVVEPGVILDQLNAAAAPHGLFFAPTVSTASRATLGGMAATDASGQGSRVHGRTSDHILAMDVVLSDGSDWRSEPLDDEGLTAVCARDDLAGAVHRAIRDVTDAEADEIARVFPIMNRGLTGYNLRDVRPRDGDAGGFRLTKLLAGSEGTLALTKQLTVRLTRRRAARAMVIVAYDDTMEGMSDVRRLVSAEPTAIEFIDDTIVRLAKDDPVWTHVENVLPVAGGRPVRGLNFVDIEADDDAALTASVEAFRALAASGPASVIGETVVRDPVTVRQLWALRAKGVGLMGRMGGDRQGTAFVEDAAVPPENLASFARGFREILDGHGLTYGMFGHADVGCVHVRPALDMRRPEDAAKIRPISDAVHRLALEHGGIIWGEHGKGFRGAYVPDVFGPRLYAGLCRIKAAFDPDNLLNPGKIAAPSPDTTLTAIDAVPFRGPRDATIPADALVGFEKAVKCNGNGACYNRDAADVMCPSYKVSGDRRQSPKGRAALLRAWLRGAPGSDPALEAQLHESLSTCLGCKACASQCPVKVDIPEMRSRFLGAYYGRHRRPLRHRALVLLEPLAPAMRRMPAAANAALTIGAPLLRRLGLVDLPRVRPPRLSRHRPNGARPERAVVLVEDTFTATFDGPAVDACETLLERLGYTVFRAPPVANGKALHVIGEETAFARVADRAVAEIRALAAHGMPLVVIEPAVRDLFRSEYAGRIDGDAVRSIDEFVDAEIATGRLGDVTTREVPGAVRFFLHCTEKAADPGAAERWRRIAAHFGVAAETAATGCCGMAGTFGHERANVEMSLGAFELSWRERLPGDDATVYATGFSCRSQVARAAGRPARHPAELLLAALA